MITSLTNDRIKKIIKLKKSSKYRKEDGVFIVEGIRMFREIPAQDIKEVYLTEEFFERYKEEPVFREMRMLDSHDDVSKPIPRNCELVTKEVMEKLSDTITPQGVVAIVKTPAYSLDKIIKNEDAFLLLLEDIQDPGNLGTMFRTAEAAGVTGIILSKSSVDIYNPKTVRSTMGSIFRMPFVYVEDMIEVEKRLITDGIKVHAAALEGAKSCYETDLSGKTAIIIGNEGNGLNKATIDAASDSVFIPMYGNAESLNASISAAVLLYEASRQKHI